MEDRPTDISRDEIQLLGTKLAHFREDLGPRERTAFDYVMAQARQTVGDVQGFDDGHDVHEPDFGWLNTLLTQPTPGATNPGTAPSQGAGPFQPSDHRRFG